MDSAVKEDQLWDRSRHEKQRVPDISILRTFLIGS